MALSRQAARSVWDQSARDSYRNAGKAIAGAYRGCVKANGDMITIDRACLKNAGAPLKQSLAAAWGE